MARGRSAARGQRHRPASSAGRVDGETGAAPRSTHRGRFHEPALLRVRLAAAIAPVVSGGCETGSHGLGTEAERRGSRCSLGSPWFSPTRPTPDRSGMQKLGIPRPTPPQAPDRRPAVRLKRFEKSELSRRGLLHCVDAVGDHCDELVDLRGRDAERGGEAEDVIAGVDYRAAVPGELVELGHAVLVERLA